MYKRIRYVEVENGLKRSTKAFNVGTRHVYVYLHELAKQFSIKDATTGEMVASGGDTINLSVLKIQAKEALKALGVAFSDDVRVRTKDEQTPA